MILRETITCSSKSHLTIKNVPEVSAMPLAVNGAKKSFAGVEEMKFLAHCLAKKAGKRKLAF